MSSSDLSVCSTNRPTAFSWGQQPLCFESLWSRLMADDFYFKTFPFPCLVWSETTCFVFPIYFLFIFFCFWILLAWCLERSDDQPAQLTFATFLLIKTVKLSTFCLIKGTTVSLTVLDPGMLVTEGYVDLMENGFSRPGGGGGGPAADVHSVSATHWVPDREQQHSLST